MQLVKCICIGCVDEDPRPPPIIHQGPQNQTLPLNSVALLQCTASGDPMPVVRWFKDGHPLALNEPRFTQLDSGTLQISGQLSHFARSSRIISH